MSWAQQVKRNNVDIRCFPCVREDKYHNTQWRIQDFPEEGRQPQRWGTNLLFWPIFLKKKNRMEVKEFGPRGGRVFLAPPWDPQMTPFFTDYTRNH